MPPRTGPRRKRRTKASAPRHFAVIRGEAATGTIVTELVIAHSLELDDHDLVFRDHNDAISQVFARDGWLQVRPATMADMALPLPLESELGNREQASLVNESDPMFQPTRKEEEDHRFVPSSPAEAQRILMELHRRIAPDYQDPPDCESNAPPAAPAPRKD